MTGYVEYQRKMKQILTRINDTVVDLHPLSGVPMSPCRYIGLVALRNEAQPDPICTHVHTCILDLIWYR